MADGEETEINACAAQFANDPKPRQRRATPRRARSRAVPAARRLHDYHSRAQPWTRGHAAADSTCHPGFHCSAFHAFHADFEPSRNTYAQSVVPCSRWQLSDGRTRYRDSGRDDRADSGRHAVGGQGREAVGHLQDRRREEADTETDAHPPRPAAAARAGRSSSSSAATSTAGTTTWRVATRTTSTAPRPRAC